MPTDTKSGARFMQIGEVAERTGLTQRTLRYYEEKGLLRSPSRMEGGFRLYTGEDLERIEQVKKLQKLLGFSLAEIKEMIDAEDVREHLRTDYREAPTDEKREILLSAIEATKKQLELVNGKVAQMTDMRDIWAQKLDRYHELLQNLPE